MAFGMALKQIEIFQRSGGAGLLVWEMTVGLVCELEEGVDLRVVRKYGRKVDLQSYRYYKGYRY